MQLERFNQLRQICRNWVDELGDLLIADIQAHHQADKEIILTSAAILLLAVSTRIIRKPPSDNG